MAKPVRMLKLDPETHQLIDDVSKWLGMDPAKFTAEAVVYYLDNQRENLVARVQERLNKLFDTLDEVRAPTKQDPWASSAPEGWTLKKEIWGSD